MPPEEGSWKIAQRVIVGAGIVIGSFGLAPRETVFGHIVISVYDYILKETLGIEVNFDETIRESLEKAKKDEIIHPTVGEERFDSIIEKTQANFRQMHRPIVMSQTASNAIVRWNMGVSRGQLDGFFDAQTYEHIHETVKSDDLEEFCGIISSYNRNTYKGRIYIKKENRTIPFELDETARSADIIGKIAGSLYENTVRNSVFSAEICLDGFRKESISGIIKGIYVIKKFDVDLDIL